MPVMNVHIIYLTLCVSLSNLEALQGYFWLYIYYIFGYTYIIHSWIFCMGSGHSALICHEGRS